MENLLKQFHGGKIKLFFILLGTLALVVVGEAVYLLQFKKEKDVSEVASVVTPTVTEQSAQFPGGDEADMVELQTDLVLVSPVGKEHLENSLLEEKDAQVLSFLLPAGEPIRAVFAGRVTKVSKDQRPFSDDAAFDEIRLEREDDQFWVSYVIVGEVLVQEGQKVGQSEVLARAGEEGLEFRSGANFSVWLHNEDDQMVKLSKAMFE